MSGTVRPIGRDVRRPRGASRWAAVGMLVASPLAGVAGLAAADGTAGAQSTGCPDAAGAIGVRVVVDTGTGAPDATCVTVPPGSTGHDVLVARTNLLGRPAVRTDGAGVLCGIDGAPATGCFEDVDGRVRYWSYWTGRVDGTRWTYASLGMDARRVQRGDADGWRLVEVSPGASTPRPRLCPDGTACTAPTTTSTPPPTTAGPTGAPPVAGSGTIAPSPTTRPAVVAGTAVERTPVGAPTSTTTTGPTTAPASGDGTGETAAAGGAASTTTAPVRPTSTTETRRAAPITRPTAASTTDPEGTTGWWIVGVVLAAASLAVAQARRTRLRR